MNTSAPGDEPENAVEGGRRARKVNKACVPCRARKVKCDAAVVGLPCSSCRSRQSVSQCVSLVRKARNRAHVNGTSATPPHRQTTGSPATSDLEQSENQRKPNSAANVVDGQSSGQTEPDLFYMRILNDAGEQTPESSQLHTTDPARPNVQESLTLRHCLSMKPSQLDEVDKEYLTKKGAFDLPPSHLLDALVNAYFDHVHPLSPVIDRVDFIQRYVSGDCSLLLLHVMLTTGSLHAPAEVLSACGFVNRSAAQESFFSKARLLYDLAAKDDPLLKLQASITLCLVILDHPTDRDFGYWFHNAINLATKLNLREIVLERTKPSEILKLYRKIWWTLYSLDVFHVFLNTKRSRLLENSPDIKPGMEDDCEDEHVSEGSSNLLLAATPLQKTSPVILWELFRICGECLSLVKRQPQHDPQEMMHLLDEWRESFASKMQVGRNIETNIHYLNIQAMSYRFECILTRLMRRTWQGLGRADRSEWAKQRFRSTILELDTIVKRVLASGKLEECPTPFITTFTALLAFHIEAALDPTETNLNRSMSRISIGQTMLLLTEGRDIPVLKRTLPIFEEIITKNNLYWTSPSSLDQSNPPASARPATQDDSISNAHISPHTQVTAVSPQLEQREEIPSFDVDFLGLDFLDDWLQFGDTDVPS